RPRLESHALAAIILRKPLRILAVLDAAVVVNARRSPTHGVAQLADADRQAAGVRVGDLAMDIEHWRVALEAHDADHRAIAEFEQFQLKLGHERIGMPVAHESQARRLLAERDALVF